MARGSYQLVSMRRCRLCIVQEILSGWQDIASNASGEVRAAARADNTKWFSVLYNLPTQFDGMCFMLSAPPLNHGEGWSAAATMASNLTGCLLGWYLPAYFAWVYANFGFALKIPTLLPRLCRDRDIRSIDATRHRINVYVIILRDQTLIAISASILLICFDVFGVRRVKGSTMIIEHLED